MNNSVLLLLISFVGCQCLQPVDEDAGSTPPDANVAMDSGTQCSTPADCTGRPQVTSWCGTILQADAGFSCVDHRCVAQCSDSGGQTCTQDIGIECLRCPPTTSCIPPSCGSSGLEFRFNVADLTCTGPAPLARGARIRETMRGDAGCFAEFFLEQADGGEELWGHLYLQSARALSARIESLGGLCLVSDLPTGAPRMLIDCPSCSVALSP